MDTTPLRDAHHALLEAAATVAATGAGNPPPEGEWNAGQILAHVSLVDAVTVTAVVSAASGAVTAYDNRVAQDAWTLGRVITLGGGEAGLRERVRLQGEALCALVAPLSEAELDTPVPTLLLSHGQVQVDQPVPLRDLVTGLADMELPGHTKQLLDLLP
ncbi:DinB family protein [Streptomyces sp. ID05-39B]|uniref:DinB family protein n=1 Tax=Streptomyces sp. ID05-39B TaxID=3028664 RepID=UPI0029BD7A71|nr:DinB family protein [Streptomyces sp. ID05-39B]MDX3530589.1 DinB family protein [Streptomyces sp. ID05-39B]